MGRILSAKWGDYHYMPNGAIQRISAKKGDYYFILSSAKWGDSMEY